MARLNPWPLIAFVLAFAACGADPASSSGEGGSGPAAGGGGTSEGGSDQGGAGGAAPTASSLAFRYLTGRFDSATQASEDPAYFAIQLITCPVDAPALGKQALYVEQAQMDALTEPYRQRLYVVEPGADSASQAISYVFELKAPGSFVGTCDAATARVVQPEEAIPRVGCEVLLDWDGSTFEGGTAGEACASTLNGASYATSEVSLGEALLESWDRGYDADDEQVWGAVAGPYRFERRTPLPD